MATQYVTAEVWIMVGADEQYVADTDPARLNERWGEDCGDVDECQGFRRVKLTVRVPVPTPIELVGEVTADEAGELRAA